MSYLNPLSSINELYGPLSPNEDSNKCAGISAVSLALLQKALAEKNEACILLSNQIGLFKEQIEVQTAKANKLLYAIKDVKLTLYRGRFAFKELEEAKVEKERLENRIEALQRDDLICCLECPSKEILEKANATALQDEILKLEAMKDKALSTFSSPSMSSSEVSKKKIKASSAAISKLFEEIHKNSIARDELVNQLDACSFDYSNICMQKALVQQREIKNLQYVEKVIAQCEEFLNSELTTNHEKLKEQYELAGEEMRVMDSQYVTMKRFKEALLSEIELLQADITNHSLSGEKPLMVKHKSHRQVQFSLPSQSSSLAISSSAMDLS